MVLFGTAKIDTFINPPSTHSRYNNSAVDSTLYCVSHSAQNQPRRSLSGPWNDAISLLICKTFYTFLLLCQKTCQRSATLRRLEKGLARTACGSGPGISGSKSTSTSGLYPCVGSHVQVYVLAPVQNILQSSLVWEGL